MCGRSSYSHAGPRKILAQLLDKGLHRPRQRERLNIRCWRHLEFGALMRIYNQNLLGRFGPLERTEAYWQWLVNREGYDRLYVVLDGPNLLELEENRSPIVGYAAIRGEQIVELLATPRCRMAAAKLLARACGDAIEHGYHRVLLHAPPEHSLHNLLQAAGGSRAPQETEGGEIFMARLLSPVKLLRLIGPEMVRRARAADLLHPLELGLLVENSHYRLMIDREGVEVATRKVCHNSLCLNVADFTRMVLGQLDWKQAYADGAVRASTSLAREAGRILFPRLPLWHPPLDDLPAQGGHPRAQ